VEQYREGILVDDNDGHLRDSEDGSYKLLQRLREVHGEPRYDIPRELLLRWRRRKDPIIEQLKIALKPRRDKLARQMRTSNPRAEEPIR